MAAIYSYENIDSWSKPSWIPGGFFVCGKFSHIFLRAAIQFGSGKGQGTGGHKNRKYF